MIYRNTGAKGRINRHEKYSTDVSKMQYLYENGKARVTYNYRGFRISEEIVK